jgi:uncharacterized coiled-coil protein SlyX
MFSSTATVTLLLGQTSMSVPIAPLFTNCTLFRTNMSLTNSPYRVKSTVTLGVLGLFIDAIEGRSIDITNESVCGLSILSDEFGFLSLSSRISSLHCSATFHGSPDFQARERVSSLEERFSEITRQIAFLSTALRTLSDNQVSVRSEVTKIQAEVSKMKAAQAQTALSVPVSVSVPPVALSVPVSAPTEAALCRSGQRFSVSNRSNGLVLKLPGQKLRPGFYATFVKSRIQGFSVFVWLRDGPISPIGVDGDSPGYILAA